MWSSLYAAASTAAAAAAAPPALPDAPSAAATAATSTYAAAPAAADAAAAPSSPGPLTSSDPSLSSHSAESKDTVAQDDPAEDASSNPPYWCGACKKDFGRADMLSRHMRRHTGDRPFKCDRCDRSFARSDHLRSHQRTHTGEKPFACELCSYKARRRDVLIRHMKIRHLPKDGTKPYSSSIFFEQAVRGIKRSVSALCDPEFVNEASENEESEDNDEII